MRPRARPPCATRRSGRRSGRTRTPPPRGARPRSHLRACPSREARCRRSERDELGHVPRAAVVDAVELLEQSRDAVGGPAAEWIPGAPPERRRPRSPRPRRQPTRRRSMQPPVRSLDPCVLDECGAVLDRLVRRDDELDLPPGRARAARGACSGCERRGAASRTGRRSSLALRGGERLDSAGGEVEQRVQELPGERLALGGRLHLDEPPAPVMTTFMSVSALESSS